MILLTDILIYCLIGLVVSFVIFLSRIDVFVLSDLNNFDDYCMVRDYAARSGMSLVLGMLWICTVPIILLTLLAYITLYSWVKVRQLGKKICDQVNCGIIGEKIIKLERKLHGEQE